MNYGSGGFKLRNNSSGEVFNITSGNSIELPYDISDVINFTAASANANRGISFNGRTALSSGNSGSDLYLRLNNGNEFTNGVYTPGIFRADGGITCNDGHGFFNVASRDYTDVKLVSNGGGSNDGDWHGFSFGSTSTNLMFHGPSGTNYGGLYNESGGWMIRAEVNGAAYLSYNGDAKLTTTSTGVSVTGAMVASGEVTAYSDARLKENINPYKFSLAKTLKLNPVTFRRTDTGVNSLGYIAQDLLNIDPLLVGKSHDGYYTVNYSKVSVLHTGAIQELYKQIQELKNEIKILKYGTNNL